MTAHIQYPGIESRKYISISTGEEVYLPATLSPSVLTDILRGDMGFEGVVVSDALEMAAIKDNFDLTDVGKMAIEAGVDMFLAPVPVVDAASLQAMEDWMDGLVQMVETGEIEESRVDDAVRRILTLKPAHGLLDPIETAVTDDQLQKVAEKVGSARTMRWSGRSPKRPLRC